MLFMLKGVDITVPSGSANSQALPMKHTFGDSDVIGFFAPATMPETATLQLSVDFNDNYLTEGITLAAAAAAATWVDAPAAAAMPAAGAYTAVRTSLIPCIAFRVHLNGNAAADRVIKTAKRFVGAS